MKISLLFLSFTLFLFSCGRKRVITSEGNTEMDGIQLHWQTYNENDTFFKSYTENGVLLSVLAAKTKEELDDSTFSEKDFSPDGKLIQQKSFLNGAPDGNWISFFLNGKMKSSSKTKAGLLLEYHAWYDSGVLQVEAKRQPDGKMSRTEYFRNGNLSQKFETDESGSGTCSSYFINGKKMTEGNLFRFSPTGIWQRYDSLGQKLRDTLYGLNEIFK